MNEREKKLFRECACDFPRNAAGQLFERRFDASLVLPTSLQQKRSLLEDLLRFDAVVIAGQAKSHCVAWTIDDLLSDATAQSRHLAEKVYLLEDCTSAVVVPGSVDYTDEADAAFARFAESGAHLVRSDVPMREWPGVVGESLAS